MYDPSKSSNDGITAPELDKFDVSTDAVRASERFDFFCEVANNRFLSADFAESWSEDFFGRISGRTAGDISIANSHSSPGRWVRSRRSAARNEEAIVLSLQQEGRARIIGDRNFELLPGSVCLLPTTIPYERHVLEVQRRMAVRLPRASVETALRPGQIVAPTLFQANDPLVNLLIGYVGSYLRGIDQMNVAAGTVAGRHIADLVALIIGAHQEAQAQIADGGLKAARTEAILKAIAERSSMAFTSPSSIGASLGISERHVHRLLESTNRTFYEHLLEARLSAAHRMLTDVRTRRMPVAEVASRCGFTNTTYFNRMFRVRFGDTPTGVRQGLR